MSRSKRLFDGAWRHPSSQRYEHSWGCPYINHLGTHCSYPIGHVKHSFWQAIGEKPVPCGECVKRNLHHYKAVKAWPWR